MLLALLLREEMEVVLRRGGVGEGGTLDGVVLQTSRDLGPGVVAFLRLLLGLLLLARAGGEGVSFAAVAVVLD